MRRLGFMIVPLLFFSLLGAGSLSAASSANWSGVVIGFGGSSVSPGASRFAATAVSSEGNLVQLFLRSQPSIGERFQISGAIIHAHSVIADDRAKKAQIQSLGTASIALIRNARVDVLHNGVYQFLSHGGQTPDYWPPEVSYTPSQASWVLDASDKHIPSTIVISIKGGQLFHLSPRPTSQRGPQSKSILTLASKDAALYLSSLTHKNFKKACLLTSASGLSRMGGRANCVSLFDNFGSLYSSSKMRIENITISGSENQIAFVSVFRALKASPKKGRATTIMFVRENGHYRFDRELV
jgi:hypothetical protein